MRDTDAHRYEACCRNAEPERAAASASERVRRGRQAFDPAAAAGLKLDTQIAGSGASYGANLAANLYRGSTSRSLLAYGGLTVANANGYTN
jgi:hypothetical protein